jgi:hypothetical protein
MSGADCEAETRRHRAGAVDLYCLTSLLAEDARRTGLAAFAAEVERALHTLLAGMPEGQQRNALTLACAMAQTHSQPPAEPPQLRLVISR